MTGQIAFFIQAADGAGNVALALDHGNPFVGFASSSATPPSATTDPATNITPTSATLNGTVNANGSTTTVQFQLTKTSGDYNNSTLVPQTPLSVIGTSDTAVSATASGLTPNTTYYYRVVASNAFGITYGAERSFRTAAQALDFNIYTLGNLTLNSGSVHGRVAAGGNATLSSITIGSGLSGTSDLSYDGGAVLNGNVVYSGTATLNVSIPNGTARQVANPLSSSTDAWAKSIADTWKDLAASKVKPVGTTLTLKGTDTKRNVFVVSGSALAQVKTLNISAPAGSVVIINVDGKQDSFAASNTSLSETDAQHVVFNFYQAETLNINSGAVPGTIWAPYTAVTITGGSVDGTVLAQSLLASSGTFNGMPFLGPLP